MGGDPATVAHKYAVLREHCERVGRPYAAITRSNDVGILIAADDQELAAKKARHGEDFDLVGTPEAIIAGIRRYAEVGSQYLTFHMPDAREITPIRLLGRPSCPPSPGSKAVGTGAQAWWAGLGHRALRPPAASHPESVARAAGRAA